MVDCGRVDAADQKISAPTFVLLEVGVKNILQKLRTKLLVAGCFADCGVEAVGESRWV